MINDAPEWGKSKDGGMYLHVPFNEDFIEALKREVPPEDRRWDPGEQAWWIRDFYQDEVAALCDHILGEEPT